MLYNLWQERQNFIFREKSMYTLLFDCDGVLADTEPFHLVAFNRLFAEVGLPVRWSAEEYGRRLQIGGLSSLSRLICQPNVKINDS